MKKVIVSLMAVIVPLVVCAEVLVDYSAGQSPKIGPAKIETSGTNTVLSVNSVVATNATVTTVNATTVNVTTLKAGTSTAFTGVITNKMSNYTNLVAVYSGVITNVTLVGALP